MGVIDNFSASFIEIYNSFISTLPFFAQKFINLFLIVLLIVIYSIFIWKFYRFIAKKDIIKLNLNKYNKSQNPLLTKIFAGIFYFIEYLLILPFLIFFWFSIFTIFLIFLTENLVIENLLVISAIIIASIRMVSYYNEDLSKDLAKLLPFTLLAISIINPKFFDINRIFNNFTEIPGFFSEILIYLAFIIILEIILRIFDFIFSLFGIEDSPNVKEE
ncbi:hypothetical protein CMI39_02515 [Candidatus Pacearchaeota archaeon]|jgi:hypothetical protein|nr:hypothetical protein [Candidatus Pacearchaeota archaeon]|tara:strand:+ start:14864 stop:15514 length:651 start_codon:yes stop_codon:yes gene_type:complete